MKERGILMSAPMVRSLLRDADPKTQTRRIVKGQTDAWHSVSPAEEDIQGRDFFFVFGAPEKSGEHAGLNPIIDSIRCPYGQVGERLWVREAHELQNRYRNVWCKYRADGLHVAVPAPALVDVARPGWRPGIHMHRWASRITLEITDVRAELLQNISEADAAAEGLMKLKASGRWVIEQGEQHFGLARHTAVGRYIDLWESINGEGSWSDGPWVWVVTFRRLP